MLILKQISKKKSINFSTLILLFLIFSIFLFAQFTKNNNSSDNYYEKKAHINDNTDIPETSSLWALINLTNLEINNSRHYHDDTIPIEGRLHYLNNTPISGYLVGIFLNDNDKTQFFNDTTNITGGFRINFTVPYSLDIYRSHKIHVDVIGSIPGPILIVNHFMIDANATSYFDIENNYLTMPHLAGGNFDIPGYLKYDNNSAIRNATIDYYWYNETIPIEKWPTNNFTTSLVDGNFNPISIPNDNVSKTLNLSLTYSGVNKYIDSSQVNISIRLYRNITCVWNTASSATEGNQITVRGQIFSRNNSNLKINFTEVRLRMSGASIGTTFTKIDGTFELPYSIPGGIVGSNTIEVELLNYPNINSNNTHIINIATAPVTSSDDISSGGDDTPPPFQNFFMVLIPIIIGGVAGFAVFAYFYLKKQEEESKIMKVPLEGRIRNLKILKETGRMEESLSYLFQSIYMELINGKYGRRITETETIRDFAIISVKDLNLNPATIYPFIQKVEEIIYARPFIINDKDFYDAVELFSPIYFELTGYNFVLNF
jgi:hypothetical protein